jgi:hypothetical protein
LADIGADYLGGDPQVRMGLGAGGKLEASAGDLTFRGQTLDSALNPVSVVGAVATFAAAGLAAFSAWRSEQITRRAADDRQRDRLRQARAAGRLVNLELSSSAIPLGTPRSGRPSEPHPARATSMTGRWPSPTSNPRRGCLPIGRCARSAQGSPLRGHCRPPAR